MIDMPEEQIIGIKKRIRESRKKRGLSVRDISEKMSVSSMAIYKWENTGYTYSTILPTLDNIVRYCELLNISADYLLLGK